MKQAILLVAIIAAQTFSTVHGQDINCAALLQLEYDFDTGTECSGDSDPYCMNIYEGGYGLLFTAGTDMCSSYDSTATVSYADKNRVLQNPENSDIGLEVFYNNCCGASISCSVNDFLEQTTSSQCQDGVESSGTFTTFLGDNDDFEENCCLYSCSVNAICEHGIKSGVTHALSGNLQNDCCNVPGCMDQSASNYNSAATEDDGSCLYSCEHAACDDTIMSPLPDASQLVSLQELQDPFGPCCIYQCGNVFFENHISDSNGHPLEGFDFCNSFDDFSTLDTFELQEIVEGDHTSRTRTILENCCGSDISVQCNMLGLEAATVCDSEEAVSLTGVITSPHDDINDKCCLQPCSDIASSCPAGTVVDSGASATINDPSSCCGGNDIVDGNLRYIYNSNLQTIPVAHLEAIKTAVDANAASFDGDCATV
jgi:hypothetical protein